MTNSSPRLCAVCGVVVPANFRFCPFCSSVIPIQPSEAERQRAELQAELGEAIELHERIGRGGYGMVFRATDHASGRQVAVKVLHAAVGESDLMRQRFLRGALVQGDLAHPHILPVFDVGASDILSYVVMPLVEGESLAAVLLREGRFAPAEAVRILTEMAEALARVHEAGYVHRDVKPQHILLRGLARRVLLIDFSLVCASGEPGGPPPAHPDVPGPEEGEVVGTPAYMSPEQAEGRFDVDARSDVYSLGVVGYQLLTGSLPFEGTAQQQMVAHRTRTSRNLSASHQDVPANLADVVMRCLTKLRANRWKSAADFVAALTTPAPPAAPPSPRESGDWSSTPASDQSGSGDATDAGARPDASGTPPVSAPWRSRRTRPRPVVRVLTLPPPPPPPPPPEPEPPPVVLWPLWARRPSHGAPRISETPGAPPFPAVARARSLPLWATGGILVVVFGYVAIRGLMSGAPVPVTTRDTAAVSVTASPTAPTENPGYLTVIVQPGGRIFVDDVAVGSAPLTRYPLAPGRHRVRIERPGYRPDSSVLRVQAGVSVERTVALTPR